MNDIERTAWRMCLQKHYHSLELNNGGKNPSACRGRIYGYPFEAAVTGEELDENTKLDYRVRLELDLGTEYDYSAGELASRWAEGYGFELSDDGRTAVIYLEDGADIPRIADAVDILKERREFCRNCGTCKKTDDSGEA